MVRPNGALPSLPLGAPMPDGERAWLLWRERTGKDVPRRITPLERKPRSAVYRLEGAGPDGSDVIAKGGPAAGIAREHLIYVRCLSRLPEPAVHCLDSIAEPDRPFAWLFLDAADGEPYQPHDLLHRKLLARWLASLHAAFMDAEPADSLPDRGLGFYRRCLEDARAALFAGSESPTPRGVERAGLRGLVRFSERVSLAWPAIEEIFAGMPSALVHGDPLPKNMRVRGSGADARLLVFDWEYAGWGPVAIDLMQATPGSRHWASPDLVVYRACLRDSPAEPELPALRAGASAARLLHLLVWMEGDARYLSEVHDADWIRGAVMKLEAYRDEIERVLHEIGEEGER